MDSGFDEYRSGNFLVTRKPKRNTPYVQKDPQSKPHAWHQTPDPSDQHRRQLPPV